MPPPRQTALQSCFLKFQSGPRPWSGSGSPEAFRSIQYVIPALPPRSGAILAAWLPAPLPPGGSDGNAVPALIPVFLPALLFQIPVPDMCGLIRSRRTPFRHPLHWSAHIWFRNKCGSGSLSVPTLPHQTAHDLHSKAALSLLTFLRSLSDRSAGCLLHLSRF